jgi:SAM-dependent methyltransferase
MNLFKSNIAEGYKDTRFIPSSTSRELVARALRVGSPFRPIRVVADVGCGSGRFLPSLANIGGIPEVWGYDLSTDMLAQAERSVTRVANVNLVERDCAIAGVLGSEKFDLVLLHWVLNTTHAWYEVVKNCTAALDGAASDCDGDGGEACAALWTEFYKGLGSWGENDSLRKREGLPLGSGTPVEAIANRGFTVAKLATEMATWSRVVTVDWLINRVLAPRAFSNLSRIPTPTYDRAMNGLFKWIAAHPQVARSPIRLRYKSTPVVAVKT